MLDVRNIHALDHFKRNTADFRERLRRTSAPEILTVDGRAELVVQSAEGYQKLLDELEQLRTLAALREALADADAGRTKPAGQVVRELKEDLSARQSKRRRA